MASSNENIISTIQPLKEKKERNAASITNSEEEPVEYAQTRV